MNRKKNEREQIYEKLDNLINETDTNINSIPINIQSWKKTKMGPYREQFRQNNDISFK